MNPSTGETLPSIDSFWDFEDPASSESRFRELLERARVAGDAPYASQVLTQIARAQGLQQDFDQANRTLEEAAAESGEPLPRVRILLERGRVLNSAGSPAQSVAVFEEALAAAREADLDFYAVDAAHMLGIVTSGEDALGWNTLAMELAEGSGDARARGWLGALYNNLGWTYHDQARYETALEMFEKHLGLRTAEGNSVQAGIARWSIGNTYRHLGRIDEALAIQMELLEDPDRQGNDSEGYTREEIGECLLLLGRTEEATPHFARAWELLSTDPWLSRNEPDRLARLRDLGGVG